MPAKPRLLTHNGKTQSLTAWAAETGIPASTIVSRLKAGHKPEDVLSRPSDKRFRPTGRPRNDAVRTCPRLRPHKASGQGYAEWVRFGERHLKYFGPWGSKEAAVAYSRFQAEWAAGLAEAIPKGRSAYVNELTLRWLAHCERTYRKRDKFTSEVHCNRSAFGVLVQLYGSLPAEGFTVKKLRAVREAMIAKGWFRKTVNDHVARIQRGFAWAATEDLIPAAVADALRLMEPLAAGRTSAPESEPKKPVPESNISAVFGHLHPRPKRRAVLEGMIRFQLLTGMRPGELCTVRPEDLDRTRDVWKYTVTEFNKMLHKNVKRVVYVGPKAQAVIRPFLDVATFGKPIFRFPPWWHRADWSPISVVRYRNCIRRACKAAGVPIWTPHRLRHNRATEVMRIYEDDEAVGKAIGDSPEVARQVYVADPGEAVARRIARETG